MAVKKKARTHKVSPNTRGTENGAIQLLQANDNKTRIRQGELTPWQAQKARRLADRQKAGKTFENWSRAVRASRPSVSNLETS